MRLDIVVVFDFQFCGCDVPSSGPWNMETVIREAKGSMAIATSIFQVLIRLLQWPIRFLHVETGISLNRAPKSATPLPLNDLKSIFRG